MKKSNNNYKYAITVPHRAFTQLYLTTSHTNTTYLPIDKI